MFNEDVKASKAGLRNGLEHDSAGTDPIPQRTQFERSIVAKFECPRSRRTDRPRTRWFPGIVRYRDRSRVMLIFGAEFREDIVVRPNNFFTGNLVLHTAQFRSGCMRSVYNRSCSEPFKYLITYSSRSPNKHSAIPSSHRHGKSELSSS